MLENEQKVKNPDAPAEGGTSSGGKKPAIYFMLFELGIEFALIIALPLIAFVYAGKWLDTKTNNHFYVIIGILLAIGLSSYMIYRKILEVKNMLK